MRNGNGINDCRICNFIIYHRSDDRYNEGGIARVDFIHALAIFNMIHKINSRNIVLQEESVLNFIRARKINHLKIMVGFDYEVYLKAIYPDNEKDLTLGRDWLNLSYRNHSINFRTPRILRPYVGSDIEINREEVADFELFKIRPIGFNLDFLLHGFYKKNKLDVPYFTNSGHCIIPEKFIIDNSINVKEYGRVSFDISDETMIERGYVCFRFVDPVDRKHMTYPLSKCSNGYRTRQLEELDDKLRVYEKNFRNFKYKSIVRDDENQYDVIVFQEVIIES